MIKYDFKCEICQGKFDSDCNIPRVLQCGHTICSKCVDRMKSKNMTRCPFDRKIIDPDEEKIAINYYILHLIDGSIKDSITEIEEKEEVFELSPKPVVNSPGWKNTLDGFIHGDILYSVESNGFIYCTDLNTGEWWFLYLNVFYGKFFFKNCNDEKNFFPKMYMIDHYGNMFQMFNKNYYTQFGKKGSWKNTSYVTVFKNKMYSLESSDKLYETDLITGNWKEIIPPQNKNEKNKLDSNANNVKIVNVNNINNISRSNSSNLNNPNNVNNNVSDDNSEVSGIILQSCLPMIEGFNSRNRAGSHESNIISNNNSNNLEEIEINNNSENEFNDNLSNNENEDRNYFSNIANENIDENHNGQNGNENEAMRNEEELQVNLIRASNPNNENFNVAQNLVLDPNNNNINSTNNNNNCHQQTNNNSTTNEQHNLNRSIINQGENNSNIQLQMRELGFNSNLINNLTSENTASHNSNNSNNNAEIRPNRFLDTQDNRRFDIELSDSSSIQVRNLINNPNFEQNNNQLGNGLSNELNSRNFINNNEANSNSLIKNNKLIQGKPKKSYKKIYYDFSNAMALFSTSEHLYFINKKGEVFTVNENTGEINLESKTFSKNIDCYATNSSHIYFCEKESKQIFRASLNKNSDNEQEEKISDLNKLEIEKKIFSDFNKEENSMFLVNNNFNKMSYNFAYCKNMENKAAIKKYSFESDEPILNMSTNICRNCQCSTNLNNEEMKIEEKQIVMHKEQDRIILNPLPESNMKNINLLYKVDIDKQHLNSTPNKSSILFENNLSLSNNKETNNYSKFIDKEKEKSFNIILNHSDNLGYNASNSNSNNKTLFLNPKKLSAYSNYLKIEKFYELDDSIIPTKLICDDRKLVIIDKVGELTRLDLESKLTDKYQCLFMLRNCHLNNSVLIGDGDLILLDPVRLSLNKLNILTGTEIIILHSVKFLASIKYLFTNNSKIYFIDTSGNLYNFNEFDKKIMQIGGNGLCKYIIDFSVHKNYLFTIESNSSLYRTNLNDGIYKEYKNDYIKNYSHFLSDNQNLIFITKDDNVNILVPTNDELTLKKQFKLPKISKISAITLFKKQLIYYNKEKNSIESINIHEEDLQPKILVENFGEVLSFINNNDCLACIIKDCVIYKLYC